MSLQDTLHKLGIKPGEKFNPGMGLDQRNMDRARMLEENGFKVKGQAFTSKIGTVEVAVKLSGTAKTLIGFKFVDNYSGVAVPQNPACVFTLKVNNSTIIETAPVNAFTVASFNNVSSPYFEFLRMLNGSDNITLLVTDTASHDYNVYFYYL